METTMKVKILSNTNDFERNIARGAKLCYSPSTMDELDEKLTAEAAQKFLNMIMKLGHGSVLEHSSITFGIEGISRATSHQLVRHRISSFSQKSQRYVGEEDFEYVVPAPIKDNAAAFNLFNDAMIQDNIAYNKIADSLLCGFLIKDHLAVLKDNISSADLDTALLYGIINDLNLLKIKQIIPIEYSALSKKAYENARYVLPNACETKMQVTMNVRSLINFFEERLCERAQDEIRDMAFLMWEECMKLSPTIFKRAVPTCVYGKCKESHMSCGKQAEYKEKFTTI